MIQRHLTIPLLLAVLVVAGCAGMGLGGSGSGSDSSAPSAGAGEGGRGGPRVSDADITAAINDAFRQDSQLASANIAVAVDKGVVTLSGNAPNAQTYNRAISIARSAPGVRPPVIASSLRFPQ